jgi:tetratricopeptide (TPR) repeat protein
MGGLVIALLAVAPRLGDVSSRTVSGGSRLDEWRVATRVIELHPLTGVGPEGYRIAVAEGIDDSYERAYRRDTVLPDRAHAGPLDVTLAGGIGSGLIYVGLVAFLAWRAWRLMRSQRAAIAGIGAAVIAYAAQQLFLFPLAELDPVWWLFGGLVVALTSTSSPISRPRTVVPLLAASLAAIVFVLGAMDVAADRLARTALRSTDRNVAVDAAGRAVALRPDNMRYHLVAAEADLDRGTLADIDKAIAAARRATQWSARDPFATDELATALSRRAAVTGDPTDAAAALTQWQRLVDRDPHRARWQLELGRAAALADYPERARRAWTIADALGESGAAELLVELDASP